MSRPLLIRRKECSRCGGVRFLKDFYRSSRAKDGLRSACKDCERVLRRRPTVSTGKGLHDTPYGLAVCRRCWKEVPLTETGELERHYRLVDRSGLKLDVAFIGVLERCRGLK